MRRTLALLAVLAGPLILVPPAEAKSNKGGTHVRSSTSHSVHQPRPKRPKSALTRVVRRNCHTASCERRHHGSSFQAHEQL